MVHHVNMSVTTTAQEDAMLAWEEKALIWEKVFELLDVEFDQNEPITIEALHDPNTNIAKSILLLISLNTFLPQCLNEGSRFKEQNKVATLGPLAFLLSQIFYS